LAKSDLPATVRSVVESEIASAQARQQEIEYELGDKERVVTAASLLDPALVAEKLTKLADVLAVGNPNKTNLELAQHIDRIECDQDGTVVVRTCRLGALAPVRAWVEARDPNERGADPPPDGIRVKTRRRTRLRFDGLSDEQTVDRSTVEFVADPDRFAGLGAQWFWEDVFHIPEKKSWAEENALVVAAKRAETRWSFDRLGKYFGKSKPTVKAAFRIAQGMDETAANLPKKMPRSKWEDTHYEEVAELKKKGLSMAAIARQLGMSPPMIKKALNVAGRRHQELLDENSSP
jgi:DNA-binding CsgD family transcriptional regulator